MKKIVYSLLFISSIAFSQTAKNVGDFNKVTSFDQIEVLLIPSDENKVVLDGSGSEDVEIVNKNGELKIRMRLTKMLSGENISATVYYKNIDAVEANEGSRISSEATFKSTTFDIIAKEGSQIKIKINVDRLTVRAVSYTHLDVYKRQVSKDANHLIEEFMLLANRKVAEFIGKQKKTFVYRIHDEPNEDKLFAMQALISKFGYKMDLRDKKDISKSLNKLMEDVNGKKEQNLIDTLAIRTMSKAKYSTENIGHYGLAFDYYSHFTSPIRRYPDVMVHRLLQYLSLIHI